MPPPPPRFALITPSASPPVSRSASKKPQPPPAKRPRLASTPLSSTSSASRSTPLPAAQIIERSLHDARRESAQRVLSIWESLAERYSKNIDEDDIIDLHAGVVIKNRGVLLSRNKVELGELGDFTRDSEDERVTAAGGSKAAEDEVEADSDADPLDAFAPGNDVPEELEKEKERRNVPPVREMDPADAEDLKKFLEQEQVRREEGGTDDEDEEDEEDVLDVLASDDWVTTDAEDLRGSDEGDSEVSDLEPSDSELGPPDGTRRVKVERALTVDDASDSEDELATWSDDDYATPARPTSARQSSPEREIIDLTTPSPPSSPEYALSKTVVPKKSSPVRPRVKSKASAASKGISSSPPRFPSPAFQLQTPPRSQSQSSPLPIVNAIASSSKLLTPSPPTPKSKSQSSRPKPTPRTKSSPPQKSGTSTQIISPAERKTPSRGRPKLLAEVVLPARAPSRARSLVRDQPAEAAAVSHIEEEPPLPVTPQKDKGKGKALPESSHAIEVPKTKPAALLDDSPSPPRPQRWKPRFPRTTLGLIPSTQDSGTKRKRKVSSSSSSSGSASPLLNPAPSPPLVDRLRKNPEPKTPTKTPAKPRGKPKSTAKPKATPTASQNGIPHVLTVPATTEDPQAPSPARRSSVELAHRGTFSHERPDSPPVPKLLHALQPSPSVPIHLRPELLIGHITSFVPSVILVPVTASSAATCTSPRQNPSPEPPPPPRSRGRSQSRGRDPDPSPPSSPSKTASTRAKAKRIAAAEKPPASEPKLKATTKETHTGSNAKFAYAISEMQGWRVTMEDAHAVELDLDETKGPDSNAFFAVYDGHGGANVSTYAGKNVHKRLLAEPAYSEGRYNDALKRAFMQTDQEMRTHPEFARDASGCTAVAALVTKDNRIIVANAGDSRSVISCSGEVKALSVDHKPGDDLEKKRVIAAGGYVEFGRVNGNLALSRALGDFEYKKNPSLPAEAQIITCDPDFIEHQITEEDEFLVVACDGIWDCLTSQQCVDVIRLMIAQGKKLPEVCEAICDYCLAPDTNSGAGIGCDNMTILIVALLHGKTEDEWHQWIKTRVEEKVGFATPAELPEIYSSTRLENYARREAQKVQDKAQQEQWKQENPEEFARSGLPRPNPAAAFERGGIFDDILREMQAAGDIRILNQDEEEDDDDMFEENYEEGHEETFTFSSEGDDEPHAHDGDGDSNMKDMSSLKKQVDELVRGDSSADSKTQPSLQGEAPPEPKHVPNGDVPVEQLKTDPGGDEPSDAVRAEGLSDSSETPLKV
ncbi:Protein phosphatase 2C 2 [Steccherinum ochraceum]|uniref:protein-serine/threonine phosphatase n=1 Tax=Steccherinum ochraceum TaxID=92696 RepID=A0A4R0RIJ0_9APHY|nr:Protein phosphatase 2C 2 [Steccherinum ochraceum]